MHNAKELQELETLLQALPELELDSGEDPPEIPPREQLAFPVMPGYGAGVSVRNYLKQMETYAMKMHGITAAIEQPPQAVPPAAAKSYALYAPGQASLDALCEDLD